MYYNVGVEKLGDRVYCVVVCDFDFVCFVVVINVGCVELGVYCRLCVIFKIKWVFDISFIVYDLMDGY